MLNLIDVDIFNVSRPWSDYAYDVFADGIWIASAKCYAAADDVANQAWYDRVLATEPETPPDDAPGEDCPDHGPYGDDDCPKCETCNDEGRIPAYGCGDQAGGWAETCPDCAGQPAPSLYELLVAECQAELDARRPVVMVMDTEFSPVGWPA